MSDQQWTLICLRSLDAVPPGARLIRDVHHLDMDALEATFGTDAIATMSETVINRFVPSHKDELRMFLRFADAAGVVTQMSAQEALAFWKDYEVGIQRVSDLIRLRGLWV
jgi:hypothetical protein